MTMTNLNGDSDELVERVAVAIGRADLDKGYDYGHLHVDHPEVSDWTIHLALAALTASNHAELSERVRVLEEALQELADAVADEANAGAGISGRGAARLSDARAILTDKGDV